MSFAEQLIDHLVGMAGTGSDVSGQEFTVQSGAESFAGRVVQLDSIGCRIEQFRYETPRLADLSLDDLRQLSAQLAKRLTYLLEPIRPIETDVDQQVVQLRSSPPRRHEQGSSYYELLAQPGRLSLCRYRKFPGEPRAVIPAAFTLEVLQRLAEDFIAAVDQRGG